MSPLERMRAQQNGQPIIIVEERRHPFEWLIIPLALIAAGNMLLNREQEHQQERQRWINDQQTRTSPPPTQPSKSSEQVTKNTRISFGDGMFHVGPDIDAGTYLGKPRSTRGIYFERLKGLSGSMDDRLQNFFGNGQCYVTLNENEWFRGEGANWNLVEPLKESSELA